MSEIINELKKTHNRVTTALNELDSLEYDDVDESEVDYANIYIAYRKIMHDLERRRERLQRRGRTQ